MDEPAESLATGPVGLPAGVRPVEHLQEVLRERTSAGSGPLLILTHRNPDPDALGGMTGLAFLLRNAFGLEAEIATCGRVFRAENLAMVRELDLRAAEYDELDMSRYQASLLVDSQPSFGHTILPDLPLVAVFDHHRPPEGGDGLQAVPHSDVRVGVGSTSAIIYEYIREAGLEIDAHTATALCCGVRFDTAELSLHATPLDREAFFETFRAADPAALARIQRPDLPPAYYRELHRSLSRARRYGPLVFGLLGRVGNPESVAEMADFFLRMEDCHWSLVGGAYDGLYHLSLRTRVEHGEAYDLMEAIVGDDGSFGGRGPVAGAQVPLEANDDPTLRRLEQRLRARALKLVDSTEVKDSDPRYGTRLTRLP